MSLLCWTTFRWKLRTAITTENWHLTRLTSSECTSIGLIEFICHCEQHNEDRHFFRGKARTTQNYNHQKLNSNNNQNSRIKKGIKTWATHHPIAIAHFNVLYFQRSSPARANVYKYKHAKCMCKSRSPADKSAPTPTPRAMCTTSICTPRGLLHTHTPNSKTRRTKIVDRDNKSPPDFMPFFCV